MFSKCFKLSTLFVTSFLFYSSPAYCAEDFNPVYAGFRMLWGLLIVLAIILILYMVLKKRLSLFQHHDKGIIQVVEVKHIMPKKSLMLVEVRGREYLVGCGSDSISTIVPVAPNQTFESVLEKSSEELQS